MGRDRCYLVAGLCFQFSLQGVEPFLLSFDDSLLRLNHLSKLFYRTWHTRLLNKPITAEQQDETGNGEQIRSRRSTASCPTQIGALRPDKSQIEKYFVFFLFFHAVFLLKSKHLQLFASPLSS